MRLVPGLVLLAGLWGAHTAQAQVFKCTEADGKTVYSQAPCTKADNREKVVRLMDAPLTDGPSQRSSDTGTPMNAPYGVDPDARPRARPAPPLQSDRLRKFAATGTTAGPSTQQLIAECEANHGARCDSAAEINYRRQEQRTPSAQEQAAIQAAIRGRREREEAQREQRERAFFKR